MIWRNYLWGRMGSMLRLFPAVGTSDFEFLTLILQDPREVAIRMCTPLVRLQLSTLLKRLAVWFVLPSRGVIWINMLNFLVNEVRQAPRMRRWVAALVHRSTSRQKQNKTFHPPVLLHVLVLCSQNGRCPRRAALPHRSLI